MSAKLCVATCPEVALSCDLCSSMFLHKYSPRIPSSHPTQDKPSSLPKPRISSAQLRQNSRQNRNLVDETQAHDGAHDQRSKFHRVLLNTLASYLPLTYPYQLSPRLRAAVRYDESEEHGFTAAMCPKLRAALSLCSG
jgi:hypothetical protein